MSPLEVGAISEQHGERAELAELLDTIQDLRGFLRYGTFDAARGEGEAWRHAGDVLARYGRAADTASISSASES